VRVGADLFAEQSYGATTTRELARALGITNGTFYHHYPNKEDLLIEICLEATDGLLAAGEEAVATTAPGEPRLRALIAAHVAATVRDLNLHRTMLTELRSLSRANARRVTERRDAYGDLVGAAVRDARQAGFLRDDIADDVLTALLLNLLNWTVFWLGDGSRPEPEIVTTIAAVFFEGSRRKI